MEGYKATIKESSRELTARERIWAKDTSNAVRLDSYTDECAEQGKKIIVTPVAYIVLDIYNEKSEKEKNYDNYVIIDENGTKYVTGSPSFWQAFTEIWDEMKDEEEVYQIEIYKLDSKNYKGKKFMTCSIV